MRASLGSVESEKMRSREAVVDGGESDDDSSEEEGRGGSEP